MTTPSVEMARVYRYIVKLPDVFDFQSQVFIFHNFLCLSSGKVIGQGNGCILQVLFYSVCCWAPFPVC